MTANPSGLSHLAVGRSANRSTSRRVRSSWRAAAHLPISTIRAMNSSRLLPSPARELQPPQEFRKRACSAATALLSWFYGLAIALVWLLLRATGDRWWFGTVLLFSPRWLVALPLVGLLPLAAWWNRRALWPLAAATAIVVFPILGFRIPWGNHAEPGGVRLRVLTCNMQGGEVSRFALAELAVEKRADVVALQECKSDLKIPWPEQWHFVQVEGGLAIASRYPLREVQQSFCNHPKSNWPGVNALRCVVDLPSGEVGFCCVHLMTPRRGLDTVLDRHKVVDPQRSSLLKEQISYRRWESEELRRWLADFHEPTLVAGDFNMPDDSTIFRDNWSSFSSAFLSAGLGLGYTKITASHGWQYGARIDHILYDPAVFSSRDCWVGPDVGSDHLPLFADLVIVGRKEVVLPDTE